MGAYTLKINYLYAHREASILAGELPEESKQFRFLRASRLMLKAL
jgi:hypothetical protein